MMDFIGRVKPRCGGEETQRKNKPPRVLGLDIIRGLALVNMILYHLFYDMVYFFGLPLGFFSIQQCFVWQQAICMTFILVSGISFKLGKNPWKGALKLFICAAIISLVTFVILPDMPVWFGILHLLALALLLTALMAPLLAKIPAGPGFALALLLFIIFRHLPAGYLSFFGLWEYALPPSLYSQPYLFFIGLPSGGFSSADYFPLLPWYFLYLTGYFAAGWVFRLSGLWGEKYAVREHIIYQCADKSLGFLGRHSLVIYMLHQPLTMGLLFLLFS